MNLSLKQGCAGSSSSDVIMQYSAMHDTAPSNPSASSSSKATCGLLGMLCVFAGVLACRQVARQWPLLQLSLRQALQALCKAGFAFSVSSLSALVGL